MIEQTTEVDSRAWQKRFPLQRWLLRIGLYLVTLWAIVTLIFLLPRAMPGDPLLQLVSPENSAFVLSDEARAELTRYYGLDQPLWQQYTGYLTNLIQGDLGWSISLKAPVSSLIASHLPWTLLLMIPSILISTLISAFIGAHSGWVRNTKLDRFFLVSFLTLNTIPSFLIGALLLMLFGARLGWLPISGAHTAFQDYHNLWEQIADIAVHLALPMTTMILSLAGRDYLLMRNSMIGVLGDDFMLVARGKGLPESSLKYHHAMRNALLPIFTRFTMQMGMAITGVVLIETLFTYPGMGNLMFRAVAARDYPVIDACFLLSALVVFFANLAADLGYLWLDPRTRRQA